uniref:23S ribosomal RNA G745 methyltransferase n=1 Tax=mine drainage metagenome TaxID=410659 RepID=E6PNR9_9ZZZZ
MSPQRKADRLSIMKGNGCAIPLLPIPSPLESPS